MKFDACLVSEPCETLQRFVDSSITHRRHWAWPCWRAPGCWWRPCSCTPPPAPAWPHPDSPPSRSGCSPPAPRAAAPRWKNIFVTDPKIFASPVSPVGQEVGAGPVVGEVHQPGGGGRVQVPLDVKLWPLPHHPSGVRSFSSRQSGLWMEFCN